MTATEPTLVPEPAPVPEPDVAPEPLSRDGAALLDAGHPSHAVEVLRHGVAAGEPSAADLLATAYLESGSWHAAVEWLGPLVEQGHVRFAGRLGVALAQMGNRERAEDALRLAVESGEVAAANDLAILLRDGDRLAEALRVLERAAEAGDPQAGANIVQLHLEASDLGAAVDAAERHANDARPDSLVALADVRSLQDMPVDAELHYRRACELGALRSHSAYGLFLLGRGDVAGAEHEYREAGRHAEPEWAYTLARFLVEEGRGEEAREYLQIAIGAGDQDAEETLAELDGADPFDD